MLKTLVNVSFIIVLAVVMCFTMDWPGFTFAQEPTIPGVESNSEIELEPSQSTSNTNNNVIADNSNPSNRTSSLDLSVIEIKPIQVLEDVALVKGKKTGFKVTVTNQDGTEMSEVRLYLYVDLGNGVQGPYKLSYTFSKENMNSSYVLDDENRLNFSTGQTSTTKYFIHDDFVPVGSTLSATVMVDPFDYVPESNEGNNSKSTGVLPVYDVKWGSSHGELSVFYFRTDWESNPIREYVSFAAHTNDMLSGMYPVSEERFLYQVDQNYASYTENFRFSDGKLNKYELTTWAMRTYTGVRLAYRTVDRFVAVVPKGWFLSNTYDPTGILQKRAGLKILDSFVIAEAHTPTTDNMTSFPIGSHELGHSYSLEHPSQGLVTVSDGLWVNKKMPIASSSSRPIYSFMMTAYDVQGINVTDEFWITSNDYQKLNSASSENRELSTHSTGKAILVSGYANVNDTVELNSWYVLEDAELDTLQAGDYWLVYENQTGSVLHQISFDPFYSYDGFIDNETHFAFTVPYIEDTAKIILKHDTNILAERVVTPNAPQVTITTPNAGDVISNTITIDWNGTDIDNDELNSAILFSSDNGVTWQPLEINLTTSIYIWDVNSLPAGNKYKLKILTTDGVNTTETVSGAFTIMGNIYLPIVLK